MEYFNQYTSEYVRAIQKHYNIYKMRLELLGYYENTIGEITRDLSVTAQGQININYQPIMRRSCSITMLNVDNKYVPTPDNPFWYERKFKLWIGVVDNIGSVYWWSQGVFITQSANTDDNGRTISIEAVDKGGALNGTLGSNLLDTQYVIPVGTNITKFVRDTLMLSISDTRFSGTLTSASIKPIDPVPPIIDVKYNNIVTQAEISVDANNGIGDLFQAIGEGYNADLYYDISGHFQVCELTDGKRIDGYKYMASQWDFRDTDAFYGLANFEYNFSGRNAVTVYTNASGIENVSYTVYNTNPSSPIRTELVGIRRMESQEIKYVNVTSGEMSKKCKQYAEYLLIKESMKGINVTFNSPLIPHLDVNRTITITDKSQKFDRETFIIQSITMPLSAQPMTITATSINWLPSDMSMEARYNG